MVYTYQVSPTTTGTVTDVYWTNVTNVVLTPTWDGTAAVVKLASGTWSSPGPDCFAGLKSDLISPYDTSSVIGDIRQYLTETWAKADSQLAPFYSDQFVSSLVVYKKYLVATLKKGAADLSQSMRINLSKEGARVNDWLKLAEQLRLPTTMFDHVPTSVEAEAAWVNIASLTKRFENATQVFTKAYPIDPVAIWAAAKPILDQNANVMSSLRELAAQYGVEDYSPTTLAIAGKDLVAPAAFYKLGEKDQIAWLVHSVPGAAHDEKVAAAIIAKVPVSVTMPGVAEPVTAEHLSAAIAALKASPGHKIQPYLESINSPLQTATDYKAHPDLAGKKKPGYIAHLQKQLDTLGGSGAPVGDVVKTADQIKVGDVVHGKGVDPFGSADVPITVDGVHPLTASGDLYITGASPHGVLVGTYFKPSDLVTVHGVPVSAEATEISKLVDPTTHYNFFGTPLTKDQLAVMKSYVDSGDVAPAMAAVGEDLPSSMEASAYKQLFPQAGSPYKAKFYELFAQSKGDDTAAQVVEVFGYKMPLGVARQAMADYPVVGVNGGVDGIFAKFGFSGIKSNAANGWSAANTLAGAGQSTKVFFDQLAATVKAMDLGASTVVVAGHAFDANVLKAVVDHWAEYPPDGGFDALAKWDYVSESMTGSPLPAQWKNDLVAAATADKTTTSALTNLIAQTKAALPKLPPVIEPLPSFTPNAVLVFGHLMSVADVKKVLASMDAQLSAHTLGAKKAFDATGVPMPWMATGWTSSPWMNAAKKKYGTNLIGPTVQAELKAALAGTVEVPKAVVGPVEKTMADLKVGDKISFVHANGKHQGSAVDQLTVKTIQSSGAMTTDASKPAMKIQWTHSDGHENGYGKILATTPVTVYSDVVAAPVEVMVAGHTFSVSDAQKVLANLQADTNIDPDIHAAFKATGITNPYIGKYIESFAPLKTQFGVTKSGQALQKAFESALAGAPPAAAVVPTTVDVLGKTLSTADAQKVLAEALAQGKESVYISGAFNTAGVTNPWYQSYSTAEWAAAKEKYHTDAVGVAFKKSLEDVLSGVPSAAVTVAPTTVHVFGIDMPIDAAKKVLDKLTASTSADPYIYGAFSDAGEVSLYNAAVFTEMGNADLPPGMKVKKVLESALASTGSVPGPVEKTGADLKAGDVFSGTSIGGSITFDHNTIKSVVPPDVDGDVKVYFIKSNGSEDWEYVKGTSSVTVHNAVVGELPPMVSVFGKQLPTTVVEHVLAEINSGSGGTLDAFFKSVGAVGSPWAGDPSIGITAFKVAATDALKAPLAVDPATGVLVLPGTPLIKDLNVAPGKSTLSIPNYGTPKSWWLNTSQGGPATAYADSLGLDFTGAAKSMKGYIAKAHKDGDAKLLQLLITKLPSNGGDAVAATVKLPTLYGPGALQTFTYDQLDALGVAKYSSWSTSSAKGTGAELIQTFKGMGVDTKTLFKSSTTQKNVLKKLKPYVDQLAQQEKAYDPTVAFTSPELPTLVAVWARDLTMSPIKTATHPIYPLVDAAGNRWGFKSMPEEWRGDIEDAALKVGKLLGFTEPDSMIATMPAGMADIGGQSGFAWRWVEAPGTLDGIHPSTLTDKQIQDVAREHVLDWLSANDDAHSKNFLQLPNGSIMGIDKGRAFKWFGNPEKDQLSLGALDNNAHTYYTDLYSYLSGEGKDKLDMAYTATIRRARQAQTISDQALADILDPAFSRRPSFSGTGASTKSQLIQMVVDRKNTLADDMDKLYTEIYSRAGMVKPEVKLSPAGEGTHVELTHDLLADVEVAGTHGIPQFLAGKDFEDGYGLWWKELAKDGSPILRGEFKVRQDGDKRLMDWLKANHGESISGSANYGVVAPKLPNEPDWYNGIVEGAKTFSAHVEDKAFNPSRVAKFEAAKAAINGQLAAIEGGTVTAVDMGLSEVDFQSYKKMIETYKEHVAFVENYRDNGMKTKATDIPQFNYTPAPVDTPMEKTNIVVSPHAVYRDTGSYDPATGMVVQTGHKETQGGSQGYRIELPEDNAVIEYVPWSASNKTQQGMLTIHATGDSQYEAAHKVVGQMGIMGVPMIPSTDQDLELLYWRSLYGKLNVYDIGGPHRSVYENIRGAGQLIQHSPSPLTPDEELAKWRKAWGTLVTKPQMDEFLATKGYLPHFNHSLITNLGATTAGKPYWIRFDVTPDTIKDSAFLSASIADSSDVPSIVKSGGMYASEERLRLLGQWSERGSSTADQGHGSSAFAYLRQNLEGGGGGGNGLYINPRVLAHTSTYSYASDHYGEIDDRGQAPFDVVKAMKFYRTGSGVGNSNNETMVKNTVSLMDNLEVVRATSETQRQQLIKYLADLGITEIRGMAVADRIVTESGMKDALKKAHKAWADAGYPLWN